MSNQKKPIGRILSQTPFSADIQISVENWHQLVAKILNQSTNSVLQTSFFDKSIFNIFFEFSKNFDFQKRAFYTTCPNDMPLFLLQPYCPHIMQAKRHDGLCLTFTTLLHILLLWRCSYKQLTEEVSRWKRNNIHHFAGWRMPGANTFESLFSIAKEVSYE